jgi:hypothetical protein
MPDIKYTTEIKHHPDCPKGLNGLRAYWEARDALSSTPPEACSTSEDRIALICAENELERKQVCICGAETK